MNLIEFLNNTAAEATGGLITTSIVCLVKKVKELFNGKPITQETLDELISNNIEAKDIIMKLQDELIKSNIIAKNVFINSKFDNTTFN